jgi:hypothetical protein
MKKLLILLTTSIIVFSCGTSDSDTSTEAPKKNNYTLVFFDKTQSVDLDKPFVRNKYENALKALLDQHIQKEGDQLDVYYIHENTQKSKAVSLITRTTKEETLGLSQTDKEAAETNYQMSIQKERKMMLQIVTQKMLEKNTGSSNAETNVSASVPAVSAAGEGGKLVFAYYFSDMVESLKNGRDFHKMAPISHDQAEEWAKADIENYKNHSLINTKVFIVLPFEPTSSTKENNPNVTDYWKVFFDGLGVSGVMEI